jgi:hypothetical protein
VDAQETGGIESVLEVGDGLVNAVFLSVCNGEGELVLRDEVRNVFEGEERDAFADA